MRGPVLGGTAAPRRQSARCDESQPLIDTLVAVAPFSSWLNLGLAACNFACGDFQAVLSYTGNILRVEPKNLDVLLLRGQCYRQMGEKELAQQHFKSGLKSDPEHKAIKHEFYTFCKVGTGYKIGGTAGAQQPAGPALAAAQARALQQLGQAPRAGHFLKWQPHAQSVDDVPDVWNEPRHSVIVERRPSRRRL